jgi:hypothetical protein
MTDYGHTDAPRLPDRDSDIGGSLADHVRQFSATDPQMIATRDHLAALADRIPEVTPSAPGQDGAFERPAAPVPSPEQPAVASGSPTDEVIWDVIPPGVDRVLTREDAEAVYNGGLWTLTYPDQTRRQLGHGHFVSTQGPFRPVPSVPTAE